MFLFQTAPYSSLRAREGLEALLAMAAFDLPPQCIFIGDGVWQLLEQAAPPQQKNHSKMLQALPLYGVDNLWVHQESLQARGLQTQPLILPCQPLNTHALAEAIQQAHWVMSF